jgi:hypothetical protein
VTGSRCYCALPISAKNVIRRDYILRMIEEFVQALARINALKKDRRWQEAAGVLDEEFQRLMCSMSCRAVCGRVS